LQHTFKAVAHYLKENAPVALDFQLTTNDVLYFTAERAEFIQRQKLRDMVAMN
jgi:hypothetical protein